MSSRTAYTIILLLLGVAASWYLSRSNQTADSDSSANDTTHVGYYLKNARVLGTGADGALLYEIEAESAEQYEDKRIEFDTVRIRYSPSHDVPWIVNADEATLHSDDPMITLRGHVQIANSGIPDESDTEIRTQYLQLDPQQFVAETDARVQIRFGARSVTATGMLASLDDDRIELKANVRGKIAP